nr:MAG TPA: hypothetical protein [Crassvirales sp.]
MSIQLFHLLLQAINLSKQRLDILIITFDSCCLVLVKSHVIGFLFHCFKPLILNFKFLNCN